MNLITTFKPISMGLSQSRTYLFGAIFILGNLLLPQLCHFIPDGGKMWLPIYFFTLIAAYKFGLRVGLLTAIFSPVLNCLLFGMPSLAILPVLLIKSSLLAGGAAGGGPFITIRCWRSSLYSKAISFAHCCCYCGVSGIRRDGRMVVNG